MKKPYQIESQRAVKQLAEMAAEGNPAVQMVLPLAEMIGWLRKGVGELIRQAGLQLMDLMMQEEVRALAGDPYQRHAERTAIRWGSERGYCVVMGQKVAIQRPRVRNAEDKEVRLGSYEMFHRGEPLTETVWEKLMLGLSTRKYGEAVREFSEAYGLEIVALAAEGPEPQRPASGDADVKHIGIYPRRVRGVALRNALICIEIARLSILATKVKAFCQESQRSR
jgi:putative transposase